MHERGVTVDHSTLNRWVIKYAPEFAKQCRRRWRPVGRSWRLDETYVKSRRKWAYLYRAVLVMVRSGSSPLVDFYRLKKRQKGAGKALYATARKLLGILFVMLTKEVDYWYLEERLYKKKLRVLQKAA